MYNMIQCMHLTCGLPNVKTHPWGRGLQYKGELPASAVPCCGPTAPFLTSCWPYPSVDSTINPHAHVIIIQNWQKKTSAHWKASLSNTHTYIYILHVTNVHVAFCPSFHSASGVLGTVPIGKYPPPS